MGDNAGPRLSKSAALAGRLTNIRCHSGLHQAKATVRKTSPERHAHMAKPVWIRTDRVMRWLHLYTGLFLVPWMLVYGTSAFCLNHNEWVREILAIEPPTWEVVREASVPNDRFSGEPADQAQAVLQWLDLDGPHRIMGKPNPHQMVIMRICGSGNYRITWRRQQAQIVVEQQQPFSAYRLMHYLHFRGGYGQAYFPLIAWAVIVDVVGISMWIWGLSGVYLWARKPSKRQLGGVCLSAGIVLFIVLTVLLCR